MAHLLQFLCYCVITFSLFIDPGKRSLVTIKN